MNITYDKSFPVVKVSRLRIKDKIWITKGLRKNVKTKQKLYQAPLYSDDPKIKAHYKWYNNVLRLFLKEAESSYYHDWLN